MRIFLDNKGVGTLWSQFKAKLAAHADDSSVHTTTTEKATWNNKAELTDIPTTLPANGGNADTANQIKCVDIIGTADSCTYHTILDWANHYTNQGCAAWAFIISGYGFPEDIPKQFEASVKIESDETGDRRIVTCTEYGTTNSSYTRTIYNKSWYNEWQRTSDGGNAATLDGKHANDFFNNIADIIKPESSGKETLAEYIKSISSATSNFYADTFDDLPTSNWGYNVTVYKAWGAVYVIAYRALSNNEIYVRCFTGSGEWNGDWTRLNDGGNADTVDGLHANEIASNPNLLINPDFRINQRGKTEYTGLSFKDSVDRWKLAPAGAVLTVNGDRSVSLKLTNTKYNTINAFSQDISDAARCCGRTVTLSTMLSEISGDIKVGIRCADENDNVLVDKYVAANDGTMTSVSITVPDKTRILTAVIRIAGMSDREQGFTALWCKLELGGIATPFTPPDPATELAKCQRYYYSTYQGVPAGTPASYANELVLTAISANRFNHTIIDFPTTMRTTPTVRFFDPNTGEEGYACKSGTNEKVPVAIIIAGQDRVNFGSSGLTVGADYYLHYTASAEL